MTHSKGSVMLGLMASRVLQSLAISSVLKHWPSLTHQEQWSKAAHSTHEAKAGQRPGQEPVSRPEAVLQGASVSAGGHVPVTPHHPHSGLPAAEITINNQQSTINNLK